jgi:hypothetical protein
MDDGNASPVLINAVTRREIAAGRMTPDHELRKLVDDALTATCGVTTEPAIPNEENSRSSFPKT